jgi:signal transduction histidine kinase
MHDEEKKMTQKTPEMLEQQVAERTEELARANEALRREVAAHRRTEEALSVALEDAHQRQQELSALLYGAHAVLVQQEFPGTARAIFDACKDLIGATSGYVALLSEDGAENELVFLEPGGLPCTVDPSLPMPIRGLRAEAYRRGEAVYDNNFARSPWMKFMPEGHVELRNVMFAPLIIEGKTVGLLGLANKADDFTDNDARMATAFGELAAIALLNSQALAWLEQSEARFRELFNRMSNGVAVYEARPFREASFGFPEGEAPSEASAAEAVDFVFKDINRAGEAIGKLQRDEIIGRSVVDVFPGIEDLGLLDVLREVWRTGEPQRHPVSHYQDARVSHWVENYVYKLPTGEVVAVYEDVTDQRRAEQERARYAAELQRSNRELQQFAYTVSHDLREPLRMVNGYLRLLEKRYGEQLDEAAGEFIDFAVDGAARMDGLIQDLLAYARVDTQGKDFVSVDCDEIIQQVLHVLRFRIEDQDAEVTHDVLPTVMGDRTQLVQLFQNLISNALKFQPPDRDAPPKVHVAAEARENMWRFAVQDNGIGIAPEHRDHLFGIFQRLHTRDEYEGSGIGLAICKKIVERHGGRIWLESKVGEGTTFYFTLPNA